MNGKRTRRQQVDWVNNLDFSQRALVVQLYQGGISISAIARIYQVHHSSVRYHLIKAKVYIKGKRPETTFRQVQNMNTGSSMDFRNRRGTPLKLEPKELASKELDKRFVGIPPHERNFPQNYAEYLRRDYERKKKLKQHGTTNF